MTYFFLLGQNASLAVRELQTLYPDKTFDFVTDHCAKSEFDSDQEIIELMNKLGGTVKITKLLSQILLDSNLETSLVTYLQTLDHPQFGIAEIGRDHLPKIDPADIKSQLKKLGITSRYIEGSRNGLSAAVLLHHSKITELILIQDQSAIYLTQTVTVQDIDDWSFRDRAKPYADAKKGMLPPKLARIMVNLALGAQTHQLVYDPFCGTGTILIEAMALGNEVIGSDLDSTATHGTQENLAWFADQYQLQLITKSQPLLFTRDVSQVELTDISTRVDAIVTEPFLGKPTPNLRFLPDMFKGLEKMYLGAFKQWTKVLKPTASVVIVFPLVTTPKREYSLKNLIDKLAVLGYTTSLEPVVYSRPHAIVQRQIYTFHYQAQP